MVSLAVWYDDLHRTGIVDAFVGSCGGHGMGDLVLLYVSLLCTESYQPHLQES